MSLNQVPTGKDVPNDQTYAVFLVEQKRIGEALAIFLRIKRAQHAQ